jgi:hypothetical protein
VPGIDVKDRIEEDADFRGPTGVWLKVLGGSGGMERKDLLSIKGKIFTSQGDAIPRNAAAETSVLSRK